MTDFSFDDIAKKLNIDLDWARGVSPDDLVWLLDHCPFLQMVNPEIVVNNEESGPKIVRSDLSNWDIHVYSDAMSSSPGKFLFGGGDYRVLLEEDEEGGGDASILNPGKGTIYNQALMTAMDMVMMAHRLGWTAIQIVDGHPRMIRGAWLKATELGMSVHGYEPTADDHKVQRLLQQSPEEIQSLLKRTKKL